MELSDDTRDPEDLVSTTRSGAMRCPASRRLLSSNYGSEIYGAGQQQQVVSFAPGCGASGPRPSRRREEAKALENLQRRVEACRLTKGITPGDPGGASTSTAAAPAASQQLLDNRPQLLQKVGRAELLVPLVSAYVRPFDERFSVVPIVLANRATCVLPMTCKEITR
jgi:hypothetical protein